VTMDAVTMEPVDVIKMQEFTRHWVDAQPAVAAFINAVVRDFHDAQDILQRTAVTLVQKSADYDPGQPFIAWALGIARIELLRYRRESQRDRLQLDESALDAVAGAAERMADDSAEMRQALDSCYEKLAGKPRETFRLYYFEALKRTRIAELLGISTNAVFVALHRARTSLRRCMERKLGIEGGLL
jgi:RNA polymerase sigma-70 factor (ECF subfamily)